MLFFQPWQVRLLQNSPSSATSSELPQNHLQITPTALRPTEASMRLLAEAPSWLRSGFPAQPLWAVAVLALMQLSSTSTTLGRWWLPSTLLPTILSSEVHFNRFRAPSSFTYLKQNLGDGQFRILSLLSNQYWQMGPCKCQDGTLGSMKDTMHLSTVTPAALCTQERGIYKGHSDH